MKLFTSNRRTTPPHVLSGNPGTSLRVFEFLYGVEIRLYRSKIILSPSGDLRGDAVLMTARGEAPPTYLYLHMPRQPHFILRLAGCLPTLLLHTHRHCQGLFFLVIIPTCTIFLLTADGRNLVLERNAHQFYKTWMVLCIQIYVKIMTATLFLLQQTLL